MMIPATPRMATVVALVGVLTCAASAPAETPLGNSDGTAPAPATLTDPWSAIEPQLPEPESRTLQRRSATSTLPALGGRPARAQYSVTRTLGALAGVIGLIVLLAWGYRAMTGGKLALLNKTRRPGLIELVSKMSLSPRQTLCLVRVGPRLVLIGQSAERLRTLDVIDDADLVARLIGEVARERTGSSQADFNDCLEREARGYQPEDARVNQGAAPDEALRVASAQQGLTETIQRIRRAVTQV